MIENSRVETTISRLRDYLREADRLVWQNPGFPVELRPDVDFLLTHIKYDYQFSSFKPYIPHPALSADVRRKSEIAMKMDMNMKRQSKPAMYDPETRTIMFSDTFFLISDRNWRRVIVHESATDATDRKHIILPNQFTEEQRNRVNSAMQAAFEKKTRQKLKSTTRIHKFGFREILFAQGYAVTDLYTHQLVFDIDEIFPILMELVVEQIIKRGGNIDLFERDLNLGTVEQLVDESKPLFASQAYEAMRIVGWRSLLTAFKSGSIKEMHDVVVANAPNIDVGESILASLITAVSMDEARASRMNQGALHWLESTGGNIADYV